LSLTCERRNRRTAATKGVNDRSELGAGDEDVESEVMDIKPIGIETDYEVALQEIERIMDAKPDTPEGDRLDVLATRVHAWEEKHHPIDDPDPIEAILHRMEALGLSRKDLEPMIGGRTRVSEVLSRKRPLTINMIRNLNKEMRIPAEVLIRPYDVSERIEA